MKHIIIDDIAIEYRNTSHQKPPKNVQTVSQISANAFLSYARNDTATLWQGDYHQAKQLLTAAKKRLSENKKNTQNQDPATAFHQHRARQSTFSKIVNALLIEIEPNFQIHLPRAPNVQAALIDVYGEMNTEKFIMPINVLLGIIGAHEWHKKGVEIAEIGGRIHMPFGVFSPIRGEYLQLVQQMRLPENAQIAWDIGTGSGVLSIILAQRGVPKIIATDNNPRAVQCAQNNTQRLKLQNKINVLQCDLFADECVDLIVCNPPWLPAKPTSAIETALYDPQHAMLKAVLQNAAQHLHFKGELWLIMSDLAEHLGLRKKDELTKMFTQFGWQIAQIYHTQPKHAKAHDPNDPLAFARNQETTFLYCLQAIKS